MPKFSGGVGLKVRASRVFHRPLQGTPIGEGDQGDGHRFSQTPSGRGQRERTRHPPPAARARTSALLRRGLGLALVGLSLSGLSLDRACAAAKNHPRRIPILVVTGGHPFDEAAFRQLFDTNALDVTWRSAVKHSPFADIDDAAYETVVLYNFNRRLSANARANFLKLLDRGVGLVILHHAVAAYPEWPVYNQILGGRYFLKDETFHGKTYRRCRYHHGLRETVHIAAPDHPVTRGLADFEIEDETYQGQWVSPDVDVLLTSGNPASDRALAWAHRFRRSRVCYIQPGHGPEIFTNPNYRRLVLNAIRWSAKRANHKTGGEQETGEYPLKDVYVSGAGGYHSYRIPSVITTPKGTLLAFCEGRKSSSRDKSPTDLLLKRSNDQGRTWSAAQVVVEGVPNAVMNPTAVIDRPSGTIWLAYERFPQGYAGKTGFGLDSATAWLIRSRDNGRTWSEPRNITRSAKMRSWGQIAFGPGCGIQLRTGRLVFPINTSANGFEAYVLFSDDHGKTWHMSARVGPKMNECQVVERADGTLMLNMRSYRGHGCRAAAVSEDGGETWSRPFDVPQLIGPVCQAALLADREAGRAGQNGVLFSNPANRHQRIQGTIRLSRDGGRTWPIAKRIYAGSFAYSSLTLLPDGSVGCLFERDNYQKISFGRFRLAWLMKRPHASEGTP